MGEQNGKQTVAINVLAYNHDIDSRKEKKKRDSALNTHEEYSISFLSISRPCPSLNNIIKYLLS
jgi:hypothetical protein